MVMTKYVVLILLILVGWSIYSNVVNDYGAPFYRCWNVYDLAWGEYRMCRMEIEDGKG